MQVRDRQANYTRTVHTVEDKRAFVVTSTCDPACEDGMDVGSTSWSQRVLLLRASGRFAANLRGCCAQERVEYFSRLRDAADDKACYALFRYCMRLDLAAGDG